MEQIKELKVKAYDLIAQRNYIDQQLAETNNQIQALYAEENKKDTSPIKK